MKAVQIQFCILLLASTAGQLSAGKILQEKDADNNKVHLDQTNSALSSENNRFKRQTSNTTTQKPKKNRPSNIFSLISVLVSETREDTGRAFNEIGTLFNSQFSNATTKKESMTTTSTPSSTSDSDEDNEITTTTEAFRITRDEFLGILRSNVQGLVQLFGKEFRVAIQDSNKNVKEFGRDLGTALRPYFN